MSRTRVSTHLAIVSDTVEIMFGKNKQPKDSVEATNFNKLQSSSLDIKVAAEQRCAALRLELARANTHPWAADDRTQLVLGWSSLAYAADRIAEKMAEESAKDGKLVGSITRLPKNIEQFVTALSEESIKMNNYAEALYIDKTVEDRITENTETELTLASYLPTMPEYPSPDAENPITVSFVTALLTAAKELQADAYTLATDLADASQTPGHIPQLYTDLQSVIQGNYLDIVQNRIDHAEGYLLNGSGQIPDAHLTEAYEAAYLAFDRSTRAYTALHCPATFGADWILER